VRSAAINAGVGLAAIRALDPGARQRSSTAPYQQIKASHCLTACMECVPQTVIEVLANLIADGVACSIGRWKANFCAATAFIALIICNKAWPAVPRR
jgi:hypothetical protein